MRVTSRWPRQRFGAAMFTGFCAIAACIVTGPLGKCSVAAAAGTSATVAVEEDWELVVGEPDPDTLAPQATVVISPIGNPDAVYVALDLNHHSQFEFSSGGLQLQLWSNNQPLQTANSHANGRLQKNNETISWTQRMSVESGNLTFAVVNGNSDTWGSFGGGGELSIAVGTSLSDLSGYTPDVSVQNSGIGFASNRVKSLTLKKVRRIDATGNVVEDSTEHVVFVRN
jgi:hypothetical protein